MTGDIRRFAFLLKQLPACTQSPLKSILGSDLHRDLRAKHKLALGLDLLEDRCANSFNCKNIDNGCIGRPFPIDNEIRLALDQLNVEVTEGLFKGKSVYLAKVTVMCEGCPFSGKCETSCATQDSFLNRSTKTDSNPPEAALVPYEDFEKGMYKALTPDDVQHCDYGDWAEDELPLDCLTPKQRQVIEMTLYEGLEQGVIAQRLSISQPVVVKHKQSALAKLHRFGKARKAISRVKLAPVEVIDHYIHNLSHSDIATKLGKERSVVTKTINKWYDLTVPKLP